VVKHFYVKFGVILTASAFEISCGNTERQTSTAKNPTHVSIVNMVNNNDNNKHVVDRDLELCSEPKVDDLILVELTPNVQHTENHWVHQQLATTATSSKCSLLHISFNTATYLLAHLASRCRRRAYFADVTFFFKCCPCHSTMGGLITTQFLL